MIGYVELPEVNGSGLTAVLMECDLTVKDQWNVWDETLEYGEEYESDIVPVRKMRLVTAPTDQGFISARLDPTWKMMYFAWGDEPKEWYWPSWAYAPPPVTETIDDPVEDPPEEEPPLEEEEPPLEGEGEMPPKTEENDWQDTPGADPPVWDQVPPVDPPPEEEPPDEGSGGELPPEPEEEGSEFDPPEKTLRLKHWVSSTEMGTDIAFVFCDQGAVHVCTGRDAKLFVVVFRDDWRTNEFGNAVPEMPFPTPGRYRVNLPLPVNEVDFAWDAYAQKVAFVQRTPDLWDNTDNVPGDRKMRCMTGEFVPPTEMSHFRTMDGYEYAAGGLATTVKAAWDTRTVHWPAVWEYASKEPLHQFSNGDLEPMMRPRHWSYRNGTWQHYDRQTICVVLPIGS